MRVLGATPRMAQGQAVHGGQIILPIIGAPFSLGNQPRWFERPVPSIANINIGDQPFTSGTVNLHDTTKGA
jgi:hypothetical protein